MCEWDRKWVMRGLGEVRMHEYAHDPGSQLNLIFLTKHNPEWFSLVDDSFDLTSGLFPKTQRVLTV